MIMGKVRKWSNKDIAIKLKNLAKIISHNEISAEINYAMKYTNNFVDAMNIAYYALKRKHSKIKLSNFGLIRQVEFEPKPSNKFYGYYMPLTYSNTNIWTTNTNSSSNYYLAY